MAATPPADWYPDPTQRHQYRYWDGDQWTEHVASDGQPGTDPLLTPAEEDADGPAPDSALEEIVAQPGHAGEASSDEADADETSTDGPGDARTAVPDATAEGLSDDDAAQVALLQELAEAAVAAEEDPTGEVASLDAERLGGGPAPGADVARDDTADEPGGTGEEPSDPDPTDWVDRETVVKPMRASAPIAGTATGSVDALQMVGGFVAGRVARPEPEPEPEPDPEPEPEPGPEPDPEIAADAATGPPADEPADEPADHPSDVDETPAPDEPEGQPTDADSDQPAPPAAPAAGERSQMQAPGGISGLSGDLVGGAYAEIDTGAPAILQNDRMLRCRLSGGSMLARQGAMVAQQGDFDYAYEGAGGIGRAVKRAATGQGVRMMRISGSGDVFLADGARHVFLLHLDGGPGLRVSGRNVLAFADSLAWDVERLEGASLLSGQLFTTTLRGTGWLALVSDGDPVVLRTDGRSTSADVNALVAWSADLRTDVVTTVKAAAMVGFGSGEAVQLRFSGSGVVVVQPSEGRGTPA